MEQPIGIVDQLFVVATLNENQLLPPSDNYAPGHARYRTGDALRIALDTTAMHVFAGTGDEAENLTLPPEITRW